MEEGELSLTPSEKKKLEQKSEWRSRQQTCRGGRKYPQEAHKQRVVSRKGRGRKEGGRTGEKMSRQCPLCICWVSRRAFVMLYADPLPKAAAGLRVQLFCYSLSPLVSVALSSVISLCFVLFGVDYYPQAATKWKTNQMRSCGFNPDCFKWRECRKHLRPINTVYKEKVSPRPVNLLTLALVLVSQVPIDFIPKPAGKRSW